jgi:hypothetical protein
MVDPETERSLKFIRRIRKSPKYELFSEEAKQLFDLWEKAFGEGDAESLIRLSVARGLGGTQEDADEIFPPDK